MVNMVNTRLALWLAYATILPLFVSSALFPSKSPVIQLNQSSFKKEVLDIEKPTLVAFTAPWCGHCKNLAPEFHKAAVNLDGIVKFANLDCDQDTNKGLCAQFQIQGFPTIKLFPATKKRIPRDYRGERKARALVDYAKDSLPMGARKLNGMELEPWLNEATHRPKVILFTKQSKSSPLYRSLALDFRKTLDFAFMRGDEGLVRSQGRLVLGVDIPTEETLPVLMIVAARQADEPLEKGNFETYVGDLKFNKIKAWLDEVAPKMGSGMKPKKGIKPKKPKANIDEAVDAARRFVKHGGNVVNEEEEIPEGGFVEWKAQKPLSSHLNEEKPKKKAKKSKDAVKEQSDEPIMDESAPHKSSWEGKMLDIEKAGELADQLRAEAHEEGERTRKFSKLFTPKLKEILDGEDDDEDDTGSILDKIKMAAGNVMDAASEVYEDASNKVQDATKKATKKKTKSKGKPFARKSEALMKQFEKWMQGEAPEDWEESFGQEFARAQADAEELLRKDPNEAARQAWESEEWLLKKLRGDRKTMGEVMTDDQRSQVDGMIDLIEERLKKKDRINPFERDDDAQHPFKKDQIIDIKPVPDHHDLKKEEEAKAKASHDEL